MTHQPEISIRHLNTDCIIHILSYLLPLDRLRLGLTSNIFDEAIIHLLPTDRISMRKIMDTFSLEQSKYLFERFGPAFQQIDCRFHDSDGETSTNLNDDLVKKYYNLISSNCPNIQQISVAHPWQPDFYTLLRIFQNARQISKVHVMYGSRTHGRTSSSSQLDVQLKEMFMNLRLIRLDLSYQRDFLGKCLPHLQHLHDLNLEFCDLVEPKYLNGLFQVAKLKRLNIINCAQITDITLEVLSASQTELEKLAISNNYRGNRLQILGRLQSLKHLEFHDYSLEALHLRELLNELVAHHSHDLLVLEMHSTFMYSVFTTDILRAIAQFSVLKTLALPDMSPPPEEFLRFVRNSQQLEELTIVAENGSWITEEIFKEIVAIRNLHSLHIIADVVLSVAWLRAAYEILKEKPKPLELVLDERNIDTSFLETAEYKGYERFLKVYVNEVDLDDMLTSANLF